jgi:hypothetical protein
MLPRLLWNRLRYGRALDILVTHAPPRDINDAPDPAHRGFKALRRFLRWTHPRYHLHGHVHLYDRSKPYSTDYGATKVINVYPYQLLNLEFDGRVNVGALNGAAVPDPLSIRHQAADLRRQASGVGHHEPGGER